MMQGPLAVVNAAANAAPAAAAAQNGHALLAVLHQMFANGGAGLG